jgi:hypothetical protein
LRTNRRGQPLEPTDYLLTLREAERYISQYLLYRFVDRGQVRRVRRGDKGRVYYLESEVKALLNRPWVAVAA